MEGTGEEGREPASGKAGTAGDLQSLKTEITR